MIPAYGSDRGLICLDLQLSYGSKKHTYDRKLDLMANASRGEVQTGMKE